MDVCEAGRHLLFGSPGSRLEIAREPRASDGAVNTHAVWQHVSCALFVQTVVCRAGGGGQGVVRVVRRVSKHARGVATRFMRSVRSDSWVPDRRTAWVVAYVSRLLSLHCPRDRGAVAGRSWWPWKTGEAWLPKVLYRLLGNTLPRSSMAAHVRATLAPSNLAPRDGVHDRGTLCQVGPEPKQMPAPRCVPPKHFAMTWSDSDTKVGHLSPFEACKAFAFHAYLNSSDFAARQNGGLRALGTDLRDRCRAVVGRNGERLSK